MCLGQNVQDHGFNGRPELTWSFSWVRSALVLSTVRLWSSGGRAVAGSVLRRQDVRRVNQVSPSYWMKQMDLFVSENHFLHPWTQSKSRGREEGLEEVIH